jgi:hypothetical protein
MRADTHVGPEQMLHVKGLIHCCSSHVRRSWSFRLATHGRAIHSGTNRHAASPVCRLSREFSEAIRRRSTVEPSSGPLRSGTEELKPFRCITQEMTSSCRVEPLSHFLHPLSLSLALRVLRLFQLTPSHIEEVLTSLNSSPSRSCPPSVAATARQHRMTRDASTHFFSSCHFDEW